MWDLPRNSHRYFVEEVGGTHAKNMLFTRFVTFIQSLRKHSKLPVQLLLQMTKDNVESVTGKNIRHILDEIGKDDIFKVRVSDIKRKFKYVVLQEQDKWKVNMVKELTEVKQGNLNLLAAEDDVHLLSYEEITEIINYISTC